MNNNNLEKEYNEALDWIYGYTNLEINRNRDLAAKEMKLSKIENLLKKTDNPHFNKKIIHIAGSKGKGSVSYLLENIIRDAGFSTGLFTSPHIFDVRERIQYNGKKISMEEFIEICNTLKPIVDSIENPVLIPTFFDIFTAIAFNYFNRCNAEYWIIETGLGGRLDSTNIVDPIISVITTISLEHRQFLGNSLEEISFEKAGIIKRNKPVVVGNCKKEVLNVIKEKALSEKAEIFQIKLFL